MRRNIRRDCGSDVNEEMNIVLEDGLGRSILFR